MSSKEHRSDTPHTGIAEMAIGVLGTFAILFAISAVSPAAAMYVGAAILAVVFTKLLFVWLQS